MIDFSRQRVQIKEAIDRSGHNLQMSFNENLYQWAYCVLNTRSLSPNPTNQANGLQDSCVLAPFFDFINHSKNASGLVETDTRDGFFRLTTLVPFGRFDQVFDLHQ